jgi:hypothetical protein
MNTLSQKYTFKIKPEIAERLKYYSTTKFRKVNTLINIWLKYAIENDADFIDDIMDRMSDKAESKGLTTEILEDILDEK